MPEDQISELSPEALRLYRSIMARVVVIELEADANELAEAVREGDVEVVWPSRRWR